MSEDKDRLARCLEHLLKVIGLCQTPRESWTPEDTKAFREAREFVQLNREDKRESIPKEASTTTSGNAAAEEPNRTTDSGAPQGGVQSERLPVKA